MTSSPFWRGGLKETGEPAASPDLVYGVVQESLVFIPRELAEDLAATWRAIKSSSTWGEFRTRLSPKRYAEILKYMEDLPGDSEPFGADIAPGVVEGDYPEWPAQEMLRWVPEDIVRQDYSKTASSHLNGSFLVLDPDREDQIVTDFVAAGFRCTRNQTLVAAASGFGEAN